MSRPFDPYWTHPSKGRAQAPRKERVPIDRATFIRPGVLNECAKVAISCGVPAGWADREDLVVMDVLAEKLREHFRRQHLTEVEILPTMTLAEAASTATAAVIQVKERMRAARRAIEAAM